ncbi:hypothetical protein C8F04DRAFT_946739, partial [Mycena alexandri]
IARRPCPHGALAHCMCLGACKVSIFSSPTTATRLGGPFFFRLLRRLTLTLIRELRVEGVRGLSCVEDPISSTTMYSSVRENVQ